MCARFFYLSIFYEIGDYYLNNEENSLNEQEFSHRRLKGFKGAKRTALLSRDHYRQGGEVLEDLNRDLIPEAVVFAQK